MAQRGRRESSVHRFGVTRPWKQAPIPEQALLWLQIVEKAKETNRPIIFLCDDRKEDWWLKIDGNTVGPRPELVKEIYDSAGVRFYMYSPDQFLHFANKYLGTQIKAAAIQEAKETKSQILEQLFPNVVRNRDFETRVMHEYHRTRSQVDELRQGITTLIKEEDQLREILDNAPEDAGSLGHYLIRLETVRAERISLLTRLEELETSLALLRDERDRARRERFRTRHESTAGQGTL